MNDSEDDILPVDLSYIQLHAQSTIRQPDEEKFNYNKDYNISGKVTPPCQDNSLELESQDELGSDKELFSYEKYIFNKFTGPQSIVSDEYAQNRNDYSIQSNLNLYRDGGNKFEDNVLFWQNHEGTKSVILELKFIDSKTDLKFTLIDSKYCKLTSKLYQFDQKIEIRQFHFSNDEQYLAIQVYWDSYLFCYFENGFENDLFDEENGKQFLKKMFLTNFKIQGLEQPKDIQFRISGDNHFLLFPEFEEEWSCYASKNTVEKLIKDQKVQLSINEDFESKNDKTKQKRIIKIDGPYIIGFDKEDNLFWIYNYEKDREYTINDDKMLLSESKDLTINKLFFYPNLSKHYLEDQFFFIGSKNLFIYHLDSIDNYDTLKCYSTFSYPSKYFIQYIKLKIIEGKSIICYRQDMYLYFYDIDFDKNKIDLKTKIYNKYFTHDLMKNSFHMVNSNDIYNYISSPYLNHVYPIIMNRDERIIGINCLNEFLSNGDFQAYTKKAFPYQEFPIDLIFYSKRLNLYVSKGCTVHFLNGQDSQKFKNGQIKSLVIFGKEVLRIFDIQSEPNIITCFTFLENNNIIKQRSEKYLDSKFILSEDNDEIAIINH